ncbi:DUF3783 domain-containing protein [Clostridium sp. KNHs205]|jgi:hypothetical protein|uniref:DUF3783 domain-containing protein n=1 Tax=Clostridium sp. KNHs205 TaxID=1449050 RepID=UPI000559188B|nr:DUF3783 domain-containing protein [Clostridium sp. KNHs205]
MKETVLLFNITSRESRLRIGKALLPMNITVKAVTSEDYSQSIGYLAGMKDMERRNKDIENNEDIENNKDLENNEAEPNSLESKTTEPTASEANISYNDLAGEMIVMAGLSGARMEQVLQALRKAGVLKSCLKAVLTDTNRFWNAFKLYEELKSEYDTMHNKN